MIDRALRNIITCACACFCSTMAFSAVQNAAKYIIVMINAEDPKYGANAYYSLCIFFGSTSICTWFAPSVINRLGPQRWLLIGGLGNILYIAQYLYPIKWMLYFSSALSGMIGALNCTALGVYITLNSTKETITRNTGIFWATSQLGQLSGNLFILLVIQEEVISKPQRTALFGFMTGMCFISVCILATLRKPVMEDQTNLNALHIFLFTVKLCITRDIGLLIVTFIYSGLVYSLYAGVYSSSLGFIQSFDQFSMTIIAMSGFLIGLGEVLGGILFGPILASKISHWGRYKVVLAGFFIHIITFALIFVNIPNKASRGLTNDRAYIKSNPYVAYLCSFLIGFGDSCFMTQIYGIIATIFKNESGSAFAIFKFIQCGAGAISFYYSHAGFQIILLVLIIFLTLGTATFSIIDIKSTYVSQYPNKEAELIVDEDDYS